MDIDKNADMLENLMDSIRTRKDFVSFVDTLRHDLEDVPDAWERTDLDGFLEALQAFVEALPNVFRNEGKLMPEQPSWQLLGLILHQGKYYE
jgi:hypothetical protein